MFFTSGRDALQSDTLYRRYLRKGDIFIHADVEGCTPLIVKNTHVHAAAAASAESKASTEQQQQQQQPLPPIPPSTLSQAGNFCVATSSRAWDSKAVISAWWARAEQVTKMSAVSMSALAPANIEPDFLPPGEFRVVGEKHYLAPSQLVLGFAVLFQVSLDSESVVRSRRHGAPSGRVADATVSSNRVDEEAANDSDPNYVAGGSERGIVGADPEVDGKKRTSDSRPDAERDADSDLVVVEDEVGQSQAGAAPDTLQRMPEEVDITHTPEGVENDAGDLANEHDSVDLPVIRPDEAVSLESQTLPINLSTAARSSETALSPAHRKHQLSARERRLLKKGVVTDHKSATLPESTAETSASRETTASPVTKGTSMPSTTSSPKPADRSAESGKKTKSKKSAARKYAEQDEEERELALQLVGARSAKSKDKAKTKTEAKAKAKAKAANGSAQSSQASQAQQAQQVQQREIAKQRLRAQHERAAEAERAKHARFAEDGKAPVAVNNNNNDDDDENDDDENAASEAADLAWLPALVGTALPGDEIIAAIPVCAPWTALGRYKYKAKLQPGTVKKGKAVKEILGRWVAETAASAPTSSTPRGDGTARAQPAAEKEDEDEEEEATADVLRAADRAAAEKLNQREGELLRGWREAEIVNMIPVGKVRVMMSGAGEKKGSGKGKGKARR